MARARSLRVDEQLLLPEAELSFSFARAGGPGGQNVNKVETKAILHFDLEGSRVLRAEQKAILRSRLASRLSTRGEIIIQAARYRDRERNIEDARERLAGLLRAALAERRPRKPTRPTRASNQRRLAAKRQRAQRKHARGGEDA